MSDQILQTSTMARLLSFPNVMVTSHQGFLTMEAMEAIAHTTLQNAVDFMEGRHSDHELTGRLCQASKGSRTGTGS